MRLVEIKQLLSILSVDTIVFIGERIYSDNCTC